VLTDSPKKSRKMTTIAVLDTRSEPPGETIGTVMSTHGTIAPHSKRTRHFKAGCEAAAYSPIALLRGKPNGLSYPQKTAESQFSQRVLIVLNMSSLRRIATTGLRVMFQDLPFVKRGGNRLDADNFRFARDTGSILRGIDNLRALVM
jgi:hypothetical protein